MAMVPHRLVKGICVLVILFGPFTSGAVSGLAFFPFLFGSCAIAIHAARSRSGVTTRILLAILSLALTVTLCDLGLRLFHFVPDDLIERWPRMPLVNRYVPNLNFQGHRFSDLARISGHDEWIETKRIRLLTDANGFRNDSLDTTRPLDVIILGDSFGAGGVSQEDTWGSLLTREHRLNTYNLSSPASGPWHEYVNFWAEKERLKPPPGANLIWQLFTGNDLEDYYGSQDLSELPWNGPLKTWLVRGASLRNRSPIRYLVRQRSQSDEVQAVDFLNERKLLFYKPYITSSSRSAEQVVQHPHYRDLRAIIRAMKGLSEAKGLRLSIVLMPTKEEVYSWVWMGTSPWSTENKPSGFSLALAKVCRDEGIAYLDLKPSLVTESHRFYDESRGLLYWYDDTHLNAPGSRFACRVIYDELLKGYSPVTSVANP